MLAGTEEAAAFPVAVEALLLAEVLVEPELPVVRVLAVVSVAVALAVLPLWEMVPLVKEAVVDGTVVMLTEPDGDAVTDPVTEPEAEPVVVADPVTVSLPADSDEHTATPAEDACSTCEASHALSRHPAAAAPMAACDADAHWHDTSLSPQPATLMAEVRQGIAQSGSPSKIWAAARDAPMRMSVAFMFASF